MVEGTVDITQENEMSPTGLRGNAILNIGHSRMRARYWRPLGDGSWGQTQPLPADPASINLYFSKGFRAKPPTIETVSKVSETIACPYPGCGFEAKSAFGLRAHLKKHKNK